MSNRVVLNHVDTTASLTTAVEVPNLGDADTSVRVTSLIFQNPSAADNLIIDVEEGGTSQGTVLVYPLSDFTWPIAPGMVMKCARSGLTGGGTTFQWSSSGGAIVNPKALWTEPR